MEIPTEDSEKKTDVESYSRRHFVCQPAFAHVVVERVETFSLTEAGREPVVARMKLDEPRGLCTVYAGTEGGFVMRYEISGVVTD
jgi:hypothetical protein